MTRDQWNEVERLFAEVNSLGTADREAHIGAIRDRDVRLEVGSLLEHAAPERHITEVIQGAAQNLNALGAPPERLGVFRVVRRLGRGGQGAVFEGLRVDGAFEQRVAIKIVNWELDDDSSRARLRQERQILAGLEHPNIARLLDGGETPGGSPYFVMEFVEGSPITKGTAGWSLKRKLGMFLEILEAVAYAHRNLVLHLDLKPANILLSKDGAPKLLDFGIAKLIASDPHQTQTAFRPLSPGYASPEQIRSLPVSTASDVYSLGVVLFELLKGRRPYRINTTSALEIDRAVCELPPESPDLGDDLDDIVLMALRKEAHRRYEGVGAFADDIRRYLEQMPVRARPDTVWYRTRKYLERHWLGVLAAAISLMAIFIGAGVAVYQAREAQRRFAQVRSLAHSFVFDFHDDLAKVEGATAIREKMVRTALQYVDSLARTSDGDLGLIKELAASYRRVGDAQGFPGKPNLGHIDQAVASYRKAARLYDAVLLKDYKSLVEVGEFYSAYTALLTNTGDYAQAAKTGQQALHCLDRAAKEDPGSESAQAELARAWNLLGDIDDDTDHAGAALEKYQTADAIANAMLSRWHDEKTLRTAESTVNRVAPESQVLGRLKEADAGLARDEALLKELLQISPGNPSYRRTEAGLAEFRAQLYADDLLPSFEDPARSLPYARQMVDSARQAATRDPHDAGAQFTLAIALYRVSYPLKFTNPQAALEAARDSVGLFDRQIVTAGKKSYLLTTRRARAVLRLSEALLFAHKPKEAASVAAEAFAEERKIAAHDDPEGKIGTRMVPALLAESRALEYLGDRAQAQARLEQALQTARSFNQRDRKYLLYAVPLARALQAQAEYWKRAGDMAQANHSTEELTALWRGFPEQSDFVQLELSRLGKLK